MYKIDVIEGHVKFIASPSFHRVETNIGYRLMSCTLRVLDGNEMLGRITSASNDNQMCKLALINQQTLQEETYNIHSGYVEKSDSGDILHLEIMVHEPIALSL